MDQVIIKCRFIVIISPLAVIKNPIIDNIA